MSDKPICNGCGVPYPEGVVNDEQCSACGERYTEDCDEIEEDSGESDVEDDDE